MQSLRKEISELADEAMKWLHEKNQSENQETQNQLQKNER
jgi:hypothetical protein